MAVDPGDGYRLLGGEEILKTGDEYWLPVLREWFKTHLPDISVADNGVMVFPYRRKLEEVNGRTTGAH